MSDLREAAEMAFEALHNIDQSNNYDAIEALRQALAQPEQKPVAWQVKFRDDEGIPQIAWFPHPVHPKSPLAKRPYIEEPLYTAPPKREWVGLTDEELPEGATYEFDRGVRWAEFKLRSKNT